jgi:hypothetical protein
MGWGSSCGSNVVCVALIAIGGPLAATAHSFRCGNEASLPSVEPIGGALLVNHPL